MRIMEQYFNKVHNFNINWNLKFKIMQKAKIIVAVRKRPLFEKEKSKGFTDIIGIHNGNQVVVSEMKQKVDLTKYIEESVFNFDYAFHEQNTNEEIYNDIMSPLIDSAFEGAKVSCFAYGQTGSGKTYTMNGVMSKNIPGLYTLGAYDIFQRLAQPENSHLTAYLSFYEIYCTKLFDLLNKRNELILRQDAKSNINVVGLSEMSISCVQQFENYLKVGSAQRVTSENSANSQSSRSHAILQITLKNGKKGFGKIYFIDLAGNERGADHMNMKKQTQIDGQEINKSLLQLKQCIRGLDQGKNHVPFRGSKLTMCLKDSFIGFCRTVMIGNISPSSGSSQNTLNTLRYADRVKELKNSDEVSKEELKSREMMLSRGNKNAIKIAINNSDDEQDIAEKKRKALQDYGIKAQEKKEDKRTVSLKQENLNSDRRMSIGTSVKNPNVAKGNSLAKNPLGTPSNRQIAPTKVVQQKKQQQPPPIISNRRQQNSYEQISDYAPRQQMNQNQVLRYRNQPMQIEKSHGSSIDMRKNLSGIVNYQKHHNFVPSNNSGQNIYSHHNQNYSMCDYNNNNPQQQQQSNYGGFTQQQQPQQNYQNPPYKANNFFSNNNQQNNTRPVVQQQQQQLVNSRQQINNYQNNIQNPYSQQGYRTQQGFEDNRSTMSNQQNTINQPPINFQSWNQMVDCITTTRDPRLKDDLRQRLNSHLFGQQNELINMHSNTLQNQIQKIKSQMQIIKLIQQDRSQLSSRQYAQMMLESIDDKIGQLQMLREKVTTFTYKLDDMEAIEETFVQTRRQHNGAEDQQLLDDFE